MIAQIPMRLFLSVLLLLVIIFPLSSFAQTNGNDTPPVAISGTPGLVNYPLPYPGILPDNPLYPFKMLRDRIVLFLITDPYKRAQFNLLQADKRLEAGLILIDKDKQKEGLAVNTIAKGENYFHDAVVQTISMKQQGRDVTTFFRELNTSVQKHIQVISNLQRSFPDEKQQLQVVLSQLSSYQKQITAAQR